jgi:hypothetical protein
MGLFSVKVFLKKCNSLLAGKNPANDLNSPVHMFFIHNQGGHKTDGIVSGLGKEKALFTRRNNNLPRIMTETDSRKQTFSAYR